MYGSSFINDNWIGNKILSNLLEACNTSTYYNSVTGLSVNVPFVVKAPMNLVSDRVRTSLPAVIDLEIGTNTISTKWILDQDSDEFDRLVAWESSTSGNKSLVRVYYSSGSIRVNWSDVDGNSKASAFVANPSTLGEMLEIYVSLSASSLSLTVNGITNTDTTIADGASTIDQNSVGGSYGGGNPSQGLCYSYESSCTGTIDMIRNQNDGLTITSTTGIVFDVVEDIQGSSQIKSDGTSSTSYVWPIYTFVYSPATGNIYDGETLIGYRDPVTLVFTAEGVTAWGLTDDRYLIDGTCVTVPAGYELVTNELTGNYVTNELTGNYIISEI